METITFNGVNLTNPLNGTKPRLVITDVKRPLASYESSSTKVEGADGELFDMQQIGVRECSFALVADKLSRREIQLMARKLASVLAVRSPKRLCFSDERDNDGNQLVRYAVPDGAFDMDEFIRAGKWTLKFKQHDPYLYGKYRSVVLKANQAQTVNAGGNAETWPTAVSHPSGSTYTLGVQGGRGITIAAPFSGQELIISFERERITCTPAIANAAGIQTSSRFFPMNGSMKLISNNKTTLSWYERWL